MRREVSLLVAIGILLPGCLACAEQQPAALLPKQASPRVTAHLKAMPLHEALIELSRLTGLPMEASAEAADLRVTLLVKDLPLDVLQARLADTFHLTWKQAEPKKGQPLSYVLYRSAQDEEQERELRARGESAFRKGIEEALTALSLPLAERAKLFAKNKILAHIFSQETGEATVTLLSYLTPQQRTSIMAGKRLDFPSDRPPPELASHFDAIRTTLLGKKFDPSFARTLDQTDSFCVVEHVGEGAASLMRVTLNARGAKGSASAGFPVQAASAEEVYPEFYAPDHKGTEYTDARRAVVVPMKLAARSLDDLLETVADNLHINIIRENYWQSVPRHGQKEVFYEKSVEAGATTIEQALNTILFRDFWCKKGAVYMVQRPLWWRERRRDVSDGTQIYLTQALNRQPLSLEDAAEVCRALNVEQQGWLVPAHIFDYQALQPLWSVLRFYGSLKPARRAELLREGGIESSSLEEADQQRLMAWIAEKGMGALYKVQNMPGKIRITALRLPPNTKPGSMQFRAALQALDGTTTILCEQSWEDFDPRAVRISSED